MLHKERDQVSRPQKTTDSILLLYILIFRHLNDEVGGACSMHGRDEKCVQNFGWET